MVSPNIEIIADSLRNCTLNGRSMEVQSPPVRSPPARRRREVTVELNSEVALPYHWEQSLDLRTGQVYYRNWKTGRRTTVDPRLNNGYYSSSSSSDSSDDDDDSSNEGDRYNYFNSDVSSGDSSSSSSSYSPEFAFPEPSVMVAAGCRWCFMYIMVPKQEFSCPRCGRLLMHF